MIYNKLIAIQECLEKDIDMPTKEIIASVLKDHSISVSERYIQKIRKDIKEENKKEIKELVDNMNDKDVFDSGKGLGDWQIELINMANEGNWTIQDIAERLNLDEEPIRKTLNDFDYMISGKVLDERSDKVFFDTDTEDNTDTEDDTEKLDSKEINYISKKLNISYLASTNFLNMINKSHWKIQDISQRFSISEKLVKEIDDELISIREKNDNNIKLPYKVIDGVSEVKDREEFWEVKIDCVTSCSKVDKEVDVFMSKDCRSKAMMFMKWAKSREWLAYLIGEKKDKGYFIHDLYLPDQRTSATLVDKIVADEYNNLNVVGVIHSHHEMGAGDEDRPSFSGHDENFINSNHNLSLLAGRDSKTGGFKVVGIARTQTPCGGLMKIKAKVKAMSETPSEDEVKLKEEFFGKVFGKPNTGLNEKKSQFNAESLIHGCLRGNDCTGQYHFTNNPDISKRGG